MSRIGGIKRSTLSSCSAPAIVTAARPDGRRRNRAADLRAVPLAKPFSMNPFRLAVALVLTLHRPPPRLAYAL